MAKKPHPSHRSAGAVAILALLGSVGAWMLYAGEPLSSEHWGSGLVAALPAQTRGNAPPSGTSSLGERPTRVERAPVRALKSPYAAYSAVAVDSTRDEIVLQDENQFNLGNRVFHSLDQVVQQVCRGLKTLHQQPKLVQSMTCFDWFNTLRLTIN